MSYICFFFFQAEDGIRDYKVTGVQTCALPIFRSRRERRRGWAAVAERETRRSPSWWMRLGRREIGRASCREREKISEGGDGRNKKREKWKKSAIEEKGRAKVAQKRDSHSTY